MVGIEHLLLDCCSCCGYAAFYGDTLLESSHCLDDGAQPNDIPRARHVHRTDD